MKYMNINIYKFLIEKFINNDKMRFTNFLEENWDKIGKAQFPNTERRFLNWRN